MNEVTYFLIVLFLGPYGIHKFIKKQYAIGVLYLFTGGIFLFGYVYDLVKATINLYKYIKVIIQNRNKETNVSDTQEHSIDILNSNIKNKITEKIVKNEELDDYKKCGIKQYVFISTLDERTCPKCGALDGKIFNVDEAVPGVTFPPMHEGCRCTTIAYTSDDALAGMQRRVKDLNGNSYVIPGNITYNEWKQNNLK